MERVPMTNEAAAGGNPDTTAQGMAGMRLGHFRGRQVSAWYESPGPRFGRPHEPGSRTARAGESKNVGNRQVAVVHSTPRPGVAAAITRLYGEQDEPGRPQPSEPMPRAAAQLKWVARQTGGETAARIARQPSLELQHEDLTYQNVGVAASFVADDLHRPKASSIALPPSAPPKPVPRPRRHFHPVAGQLGRETPVTANSSPLDTSVRLPNLQRTHTLPRTAGGRESKHSNSWAGPDLPPTAPMSARSLPPPPLPRSNSLSVAGQTDNRLPVATTARSSGPSTPPPMPQHSPGIPGATEGPASGPIYDEIDAHPSTPSPLPERWSLTPAAQPYSDAANPTYTGPSEWPPRLSLGSAQGCRKRALAHLATAGVEDPELELVRLYRRHVPEMTHFDRRVQFAKERYWEEMQNNAYVLAAFDLANGDKTRFHSLVLPGRTEDQRRQVGGQPYAQYSADIKPFAGPPATEYLQSFEDQPVAIHELVFRDAVAFARAHRAGLGTSAPPLRPDATRV